MPKQLPISCQEIAADEYWPQAKCLQETNFAPIDSLFDYINVSHARAIGATVMNLAEGDRFRVEDIPAGQSLPMIEAGSNQVLRLVCDSRHINRFGLFRNSPAKRQYFDDWSAKMLDESRYIGQNAFVIVKHNKIAAARIGRQVMYAQYDASFNKLAAMVSGNFSDSESTDRFAANGLKAIPDVAVGEAYYCCYDSWRRVQKISAASVLTAHSSAWSERHAKVRRGFALRPGLRVSLGLQ